MLNFKTQAQELLRRAVLLTGSLGDAYKLLSGTYELTRSHIIDKGEPVYADAVDGIRQELRAELDSDRAQRKELRLQARALIDMCLQSPTDPDLVAEQRPMSFTKHMGPPGYTVKEINGCRIISRDFTYSNIEISPPAPDVWPGDAEYDASVHGPQVSDTEPPCATEEPVCDICGVCDCPSLDPSVGPEGCPYY